MATSNFRRDFLWRKLVTPASDVRDFLGRACTATLDPEGRPLFAVPAPTVATAVTLGTRYEHSAGALLEVTVAGTTAAGEPALPGAVGGTVVSGTATFMRISTI